MFEIYNKNKKEYLEMLGSLSEVIDDLSWMIKNSDEYKENLIYDKIECMKKLCGYFYNEQRSIGTLMKDLDI